MSKQVTRCVERIWDRGWWSNCKCTGKYLHTDGRHYCGTHYPPNVQARRDKIDAKHAEEQAAWRRQQDIQLAARNETARKVAMYDEMLAILKEIVSDERTPLPLGRKVRDVIAKAQGGAA